VWLNFGLHFADERCMQRIAAIIGLAAALLAADPAIAGPPDITPLAWPPKLPGLVSRLRTFCLCELLPIGHSCNATRYSVRARAESRGRLPELRSGH